MIARGTSHCMESCDHEEADTRMLVHLQDALTTGSTTCLVRTVDHWQVPCFDCQSPSCRYMDCLWHWKNFMYIHINIICNALGRNRSMALPIFHSFTGCDTTSSFWERGKKSAWESWKAYPEVTKAFLYMVSNPHLPITVEAQHFQRLEHFTVILYDKTSDLEFVDEARRELFCYKNRTMENIPPTQDALLQHCKRVGYQAGIWTTSDMAQQQTPPPEGHG